MIKSIATRAAGITPAIACVVLSLGCATANAHHDAGRYTSSQAYYDYAKVIDVDPIIVRRVVSTPREECHVEHSGYYREVRHEPNHGGAPMLLGSIIGGVIGHQFGDGNARKVSTVAGALLGGTIAHHAAHQRYREPSSYDYVPRTERHCTVVEDVSEIEQIEGYNVTYRYQGQTFVKRTDTHPGKRIRIRVEVTPSLAAVDGRPDTPFRFRSSMLG